MSSSGSSKDTSALAGLLVVLFLVGGAALLLAFALWFFPWYGVYSAQQSGKAKLAEAQYSRQAQVEDAKAKLEAAQYLKKAADEIESSLSPAYLSYLRIQMLEEVGRTNPNAVYFDTDSAPPVVVTPAQ